jgi:hypothetical protein
MNKQVMVLLVVLGLSVGVSACSPKPPITQVPSPSKPPCKSENALHCLPIDNPSIGTSAQQGQKDDNIPPLHLPLHPPLHPQEENRPKSALPKSALPRAVP